MKINAKKKIKGAPLKSLADGAKSSSITIALIGVIISVGVGLFLTYFKGSNDGNGLSIVQTSLDKRLEAWVTSWNGNDVEGGASQLAIGKACAEDTCYRGTFAKKNVRKGELLLSVPLSKSLRLRHAPTVVEQAYYLLISAHIGPEFNKSHPYFWQSMPTPDELLDTSMLSEKQLEEIQCDDIIADGKGARVIAEELVHEVHVSAGESQHVYQPLKELLPWSNIDVETVLYVGALIRSRYFNVIMRDTVHGIEQDVIVPHLLPIMDMINHSPYLASSSVPEYNGTHMNQFALRDIKEGEEVYWNYYPGVDHRNDYVFRSYGFLLEQDPPLLYAMDLPDFLVKLRERNFPETDDGYYGPAGQMNTRGEYERLKGILESMPTTAEQDEALLSSSEKTMHWKDVMIVRFRLKRKLALIRAMDLILKHL